MPRSSAFFLGSLSAVLTQAYTVTNSLNFMNKNIDSIVFPGQYDRSHMHSFFGSDAVTLNTTTSAELQQGCSSTENPNDLSVYWIPTLVVVDGDTYTKVPFTRFSAYYVSIENAEVAIPQDFKQLAGRPSAAQQSDLDDLAGLQWFCEGDPSEAGKDAAAWPTTTCSTHLQALLLFHDCVDEQTLASAYSGTQHWNSTYRAANRCPAGMRRMPQLRFSIRYDLRRVLPGGWSGAAGPPPLELACGTSYCMHGDFINGWLPEAAVNMLQANDKREFAGVDGPNGAADAGSACGAENAADADPDRGTSDYAASKAILAGSSRRSSEPRRRGRLHSRG